MSLCAPFYKPLYGGELVISLYFQEVSKVLIGPDHSASGVMLKDGTEVHCKAVLSNATPHVTFKHLTPQVITL